MMELAERFVKSFERMALALEKLASGHVLPEPKKTETEKIAEAMKEASKVPEIVYETMSRDSLLAICEKRGIAVPARTKTPTLIKKIKADDAARASQVCLNEENIPHKTDPPKSDPEQSPNQPKKEKDPITEPPLGAPAEKEEAPKDEPDPFAVKPKSDPAGSTPKEFTETEVRVALQKYMQAHGGEKTIEVLQKVGKCNSFADLQEKKFNAIMEEIDGKF